MRFGDDLSPSVLSSAVLVQPITLLGSPEFRTTVTSPAPSCVFFVSVYIAPLCVGASLVFLGAQAALVRVALRATGVAAPPFVPICCFWLSGWLLRICRACCYCCCFCCYCRSQVPCLLNVLPKPDWPEIGCLAARTDLRSSAPCCCMFLLRRRLWQNENEAGSRIETCLRHICCRRCT